LRIFACEGAFDPTLPVNNSLVSSSELRNQLNGLKSLIDD
jgi:hypothetical protein